MSKRVLKIVGIIFFFLIVLSIPLLINLIITKSLIPFGHNWAGATELERVWLYFWASYFGCVFTSVVTFVVLYLTIRQNNIQNAKNRKEAHKENLQIQEVQDKRFQYELSLNHISEIRSTAVLMYHSFINSKVDTMYTRILLDKIDDIDVKEIQTLMMSVFDESNKAYIEMQMLLSYSGDRDAEVDKLMDLVKKVSDESYYFICDLFWVFVMSRTLSDDKTNLQAEVYKYSSENSKRIVMPEQKHIWDIIIEKKMFNIPKNRFNIVMAWHDEWKKINDTYLVALRGLVNHYYQKTKLLSI